MKFPLFWWPLSHFESIGCDFFKVEFKKNDDNKLTVTKIMKSSLHIRLTAHLIQASNDKQLTPKKKPMTPPVSLKMDFKRLV